MPLSYTRSTFLRIVRDAAGLTCLGAIAPVLAAPGGPTVVPLGGAAPGALPTAFAPALTGGGGPVAWQVREDASVDGGRVLAQISEDRTDTRFPLCIYQPLAARDIDVSVRMKPLSGRVDRAGGLAVRLADPDNYYVVRANALEDNVRLYHVVGGVRTQFAGLDVKIPSGAWQQLAIAARGRNFEVSLDGKTLFSATDTRLTTAGRVALWTKADSVTYFDDLQIRNL